MSLASSTYMMLAPSAILDRAARQRTDVELDEGFLHSIRTRGIYTPLLVARHTNSDEASTNSEIYVLVAGGRRLAAARQLSLTEVPVRLVEDGLEETDCAIIELEENIRRRDLSWQDEARAIKLIHTLWLARDEGWTLDRSKKVLGLESTFHLWMRVARALENSEEAERIANAPGMRAAYNICMRIDERAHDAILNELSDYASVLTNSESTSTDADTTVDEHGNGTTVVGGEANTSRDASSREQRSEVSPPQSTLRDRSGRVITRGERDDVLCADFREWASTYSGAKFNFLHCDFPYGKRVFSGAWGGKNSDEQFKYDDKPSTYWELCRTLCEHRDRLLTPSAHMMFWLSADIAIMHETIEFFRQHASEFIFQERSLIWHKSDNTGIVHDARRGPRWTYETALMATSGDRVLCKPLAASYSAPTARSLHPSVKPEPVLRHFFQMFCDSTTRLLDPTCGSGSALRSAESLGAQSVLGIEQSPEFAEAARKALREFRALRAFQLAREARERDLARALSGGDSEHEDNKGRDQGSAASPAGSDDGAGVTGEDSSFDREKSGEERS